MRAVGVDLGGQSVRALVEIDAEPARRPVGRESSLEAVLDAIAGVLHDVAAADAARIVVAIPSFVGPEGLLEECPAVPSLTGVALGSLLCERFPTAEFDVVPDLAAAAYGEATLGRGRGVHRFLCVAIGTGVNAAAVVDGRLVETAFGCLGDAGHVLVDPDGPECACGGRGCLEAITSGYALARAGGPFGFEDAAAVEAAARAGDTDAVALLDRAGTALGRAISTWSVMLWPDVVAVAGGVAGAGDLLLDPARAELARVGPPYVTRRLQIELAALGDRATVVGALQVASTAQSAAPIAPADVPS